jgi:hypothetical protein
MLDCVVPKPQLASLPPLSHPVHITSNIYCKFFSLKYIIYGHPSSYSSTETTGAESDCDPLPKHSNDAFGCRIRSWPLQTHFELCFRFHHQKKVLVHTEMVIAIVRQKRGDVHQKFAIAKTFK